MQWQGVIPAITTPFTPQLEPDLEALRAHIDWLVGAGCTGIVALGSLGEGATLRFEEKLAVLEACQAGLAGRAPLVAGIAGLSTAEAVELARAAERAGCQGLMVLPPYVYRGDWRETSAHFRAVCAATPLSCMLYNNPIAYVTDLTPEQVRELCALDNVHAIKESSADVRRVAALRALLGERLQILMGVDDLIVEGVAAGAVGWIAGLVNALPDESVRLYELARAGKTDEARRLYEWFLPLLRLDVVPKFVQLIKLVQAELGRGSARVRPPRLELCGTELNDALRLIRQRLAQRPTA